MVLVGSHVLVVVEPRDLGLWAFSSRFCLLGFGVSFSLCLAHQRVGSISRYLYSVPIPFHRSDAGARWSIFGCVEVYVYGGGSGSLRSCGLLGCEFRLALPTGDVGVPGVDDVAVITWQVGPWLEVFYCLVLLLVLA